MIWTIAQYELKKVLRSKSVLINMFLLPLLLIFILGAALGGIFDGGGDKQIDPIKVAIVGDGTAQGNNSEMMQKFLQSPEVKKLIVPGYLDSRREAVNSLNSGEYSFAVIVPKGFEQNVQAGNKATLEMIPGKISLKSMIAESAFRSFIDQVNHIQAASMTAGPKSAAILASGTDQTTSLVEKGKLNSSGKGYSSYQFYAASMLIMFMLYSGMTTSTSLFSEKTQNTLQRIGSMPVKPFDFFMGKLIGNTVFAICQALVIIAVCQFGYGVDWGDRPLLLILICLLVILASTAFAVIVASLSSSESTSHLILQILTILMTFASGGMAPLPDEWTNTGGAFTINHWGMNGLLRIILDQDMSQIMPNILMLGAICAGLFLIATITYKKVGYHA